LSKILHHFPSADEEKAALLSGSHWVADKEGNI
jgi:hypothetical protein